MTNGGVSLGPGLEFETIASLVRRWGALARGIGDDASVIAIPAGAYLVASTDTSLEHVHFRREWLLPREVGYRAVAAALSDLAAMAATPIGVLVALTVPDGWRDSVTALGDGIADAVTTAGCVVLGGDTTAGRDLSLTVTVLGFAERPMRRAGAREGDLVYLTGVLGAPWLALAALARGTKPGDERERFARPVPRLREALWLAAHGATSAIDISDGLAADAAHLAAASEVRLRLHLERVPRIPGVGAADAARSGEEYELLVTAPPALDATAFVEIFGVPLTAVGEVVAAGRAVVEVFEGVQRVDPPRGYDHFSP